MQGLRDREKRAAQLERETLQEGKSASMLEKTREENEYFAMNLKKTDQYLVVTRCLGKSEERQNYS